MDLLQFLIERFYSQYITLREFYINAAAIRSVSSVIAVPSLPPDPPRFSVKRKDIKPRARKGNTPTTPRREVPKVEPQLQTQPQREPHLLIDPFPQGNPAHMTPQPQQHLQAPMPTWATYAPSPVTVPAVIHQSQTPQPQAFAPISHPAHLTTIPTAIVHPVPQTQAQGQWVTFGDAHKNADPFSGLLSMAKDAPKPETRTYSPNWGTNNIRFFAEKGYV